jgi:hypothetical protein
MEEMTNTGVEKNALRWIEVYLPGININSRVWGDPDELNLPVYACQAAGTLIYYELAIVNPIAAGRI